jgi:hypothetical protein
MTRYDPTEQTVHSILSITYHDHATVDLPRCGTASTSRRQPAISVAAVYRRRENGAAKGPLSIHEGRDVALHCIALLCSAL